MTALYAIIGLIVLLGGLGIWFYTRGQRSGESVTSAHIAEETADNLRRQDKAGTGARAEEVVDRLRRGGF